MPVASKVYVRESYPSEVGFQRHLYAAPPGGNPDFDAERDVYQKLDDRAAVAHRRLISLEKPHASDRHPWAAFVMSLFHRTPEHLSATKELLTRLWDEEDETQLKYEKMKEEGYPDTVQEFLRLLDPHARERAAFRNILISSQDSRLIRYLGSIPWGVINLAHAPRHLLLSDNPVIITPLGKPGGHLAMPISPTRLFVAAPEYSTFQSIKELGPNRITRICNQLVVERASAIIIAKDRTQSEFIKRHFGTNRIGSLASGFQIHPPR